MSTHREMIHRPKYDDRSTEHGAALLREDLPCPADTRLWISLTPEEKFHTKWCPKTRHWWLEQPAERGLPIQAKDPSASEKPETKPR